MITKWNPAWLMSVLLHGIAALMLFTVLSSPLVQLHVKQAARIFAPLVVPAAANALRGGGSGGDRSPTPASAGRAPRFAARQWTPPAAVIPDQTKLVMDPTLLGPPDLQIANNHMNVWGDPLGKLGPPSNGPGDGGGIGSKRGGGIGDGDGPGLGPDRGPGGPDGGEVYSAGGSVSAPALVYKMEPEYSEEARKAKYSGVVLLAIEVDQAGHPRNVRVARGIGLGLDERAIEAVKRWRFKPGMRNGKPVVVRANIEVNFRLL